MKNNSSFSLLLTLQITGRGGVKRDVYAGEMGWIFKMWNSVCVSRLKFIKVLRVFIAPHLTTKLIACLIVFLAL